MPAEALRVIYGVTVEHDFVVCKCAPAVLCCLTVFSPSPVKPFSS